MKKIVSVMLIVLLSISACMIPSSAETTEQKNDKKLFVNHCNMECNQKDSQYQFSQDEIDELLYLYAIGDENQKQVSEELLNNSGVFIFSDESSDSSISLQSEPADVNLSGVIESYDGNTGNWALTVGGTWNNLSAIGDEIGIWWGAGVGKTKNIGGLDAVGIVLYNTYGTVPTLVSSNGYIHDGNGNRTTLYNAATYDASRGIAFEYQDYITCIDYNLLSYKWNYMGYGFSATMRFSSNYVNFHGKAKGFLAHSWDNTTINSIGFSGGSGSFGLNIGWSHDKDYFLTYSGMDTDF